MDPGGQGTQLHAPSLGEGTTVGAYVIGECIGIGGFGEVYRAKHAVIGREVAVKVLHRRYSHDAEAIARFVSEARAVNKVSHPGIVEIYDFGTFEGRQYCVMELVTGQTLRDLLRAKSKLSLDEALPILQGVADAIDAAHGAGVAHRDIKPDNIFITSDGVKLIDFGLAKLKAEDAVPVTQTGSVFGTPLYMSPEQCRGKNVDLKTDQYSFGVVAYQMLVGELPFTGDALELALHHLNDPPPPPRIDDRVDRVLLALLAKDPAERPASAREAIDALVGEAPLPTVRKLRRPPRGGAPAIVAVMLALGGSIVWFFLQRTPAEKRSAVPDCASGDSRLVGIWDMPMRARIAARFGTIARADVTGTWKLIDVELNAFAARWAKDWDDACHSDDRTRDPLLYAQRMACLDNALLVLRGVVEPLPAADPSNVAFQFPGTITRRGRLADCESTDVLRAQVPAPPPQIRAAVSAQLIELQRLEVRRRAIMDFGRQGDLDALVASYDDIVKRLDTLHSPAAAEVAHYRALFLRGAALRDPARRAQSQEGMTVAIRLAERYRNDIWLARDLVSQLENETTFNGPESVIDGAIAGAEAALVRAGSPAWLAIELAAQRARADGFRGRLGEVLARTRATLAAYPRDAFPPPFDHNSVRIELAFALAALGQPTDAAAPVREEITELLAAEGPVHNRVAIARTDLGELLGQAGDVAGATSEFDQALAILDQIDDHSPALAHHKEAVLVEQLDLQLREHAGSADQTFARLQDTGLDLGDVAQLARDSGRLDALAYLVDHAQLAPALQAELTAELAFMHDPAHAPPPDRPGAVAFALALRGDARGALGKLESTQPAIGWRRAEIAAARGLAMLRLGDARAGIASLEESQFAMQECCLDTHYFEPAVALALAQALANTDRKQARLYATEAVRGFGRLGREADRKAAQAWLADNR